MLLHQIITSHDTRFLREVIEHQIQDTWEGCWTEQTKTICSKYHIDIDTLRETSKEQLKRDLKNKINTELEQVIQHESKQKTKMRFCNAFHQKKYTLSGKLKYKL